MLQFDDGANYNVIIVNMTVNAVAEILKVDIHVQLINIPVSFSA